jgi:hypothetical protein
VGARCSLDLKLVVHVFRRAIANVKERRIDLGEQHPSVLSRREARACLEWPDPSVSDRMAQLADRGVPTSA